MTNKVNTVFLDLDGVLADFNSALVSIMIEDGALPECERDNVVNALDHGRPLEGMGLHKRYMFKLIASHGATFWNVRMKEYGYSCSEVMKAIYATGVKANDVHVLTAYPDTGAAECVLGKVLWCSSVGLPHPILCKSSQKHLLARSGALLVDDRLGNCEKFADAGGSYLHVMNARGLSLNTFSRMLELAIMDGTNLTVDGGES